MDKKVSSDLSSCNCSDTMQLASKVSRELLDAVKSHKEGKRFPKGVIVSKLKTVIDASETTGAKMTSDIKAITPTPSVQCVHSRNATAKKHAENNETSKNGRHLVVPSTPLLNLTNFANTNSSNNKRKAPPPA